MSNKLGEIRRALRACVGKIALFEMRQGFGATAVPMIEHVMRGARVTDRDLYTALASDDDEDYAARDQIAQKLAAPMIIPAGKDGKATAVVSVRGLALYDVEYQPMCFSSLLLSQTMNALANDPEIGTIILDIDSPGGTSTGVMEAADSIFAARAVKRVVALVNPLCASAAYWIASQASEITAVPSADVGSIGVYMLHADCSKMMEEAGIKFTFIFAAPYKTEGNSYEPLSDEARDYWQGEVDQCYADFLKAVARGRGVPVATVQSDFGEGRCVSAILAKKAGMIDRIAPIHIAMARWGVSSSMLNGRRRGEAVEQTAQKPAIGKIELQKNERGVEIVGSWPARAGFAVELIEDADPAFLSVEGTTLKITVANGHAIYTEDIDHLEPHVWVGTLVSGVVEDHAVEAIASESHTPVPAEAEPANDGKAAARRRRIGILAA